MRDDPRIAEAQALPIEEIADRLGITGDLTRAGAELVGPCPKCGGRDRFGINRRDNVFLCRKCDGRGDGISLVRFVLGLDFLPALDWLCGERDDTVSQEELDRRRKRAEASRQEREDRARRERRKAIQAAQDIWNRCGPIARTAAADYLALRGLKRLADLAPPSLRFHADLPYMAREDGRWVEIHRGPAMVASVTPGRRGGGGIHRTWIDLDRPKGKARIEHKGEVQAAKKTLGSIKGGVIRLVKSSGDPTIVMGEGIETTASAWVSGAYPGAAFWAGVSLGNMAGHRKLGPGLRYAGIPDLSDEDAFLPPKACKRLIFIQDGDSEPRMTRAQLLSGLRRAMALRPGLTGYIAYAGDGRDLNDLLLEGAA